jgi:hypothetical protein
MMLGELDKSERVLRPGIRRVRGRPVEQDPDVGDDHLALPFRNDCADCFFDLCDQLLGLLDTQPSSGTKFNSELAGIALREKFRANQSKNNHRYDE